MRYTLREQIKDKEHFGEIESLDSIRFLQRLKMRDPQGFRTLFIKLCHNPNTSIFENIRSAYPHHDEYKGMPSLKPLESIGLMDLILYLNYEPSSDYPLDKTKFIVGGFANQHGYARSVVFRPKLDFGFDLKCLLTKEKALEVLEDCKSGIFDKPYDFTPSVFVLLNVPKYVLAVKEKETEEEAEKERAQNEAVDGKPIDEKAIKMIKRLVSIACECDFSGESEDYEEEVNDLLKDIEGKVLTKDQAKLIETAVGNTADIFDDLDDDSSKRSIKAYKGLLKKYGIKLW